MILNYLIEGLDRLGKDTLIDGLLNRYGYYEVHHRKKPMSLSFYNNFATPSHSGLRLYQSSCFKHDMELLKASELCGIRNIYNRAWLGEAVYSNLYRGYDGNYVFELEHDFGIHTLKSTRLILLIEDFLSSKHFVDDGDSFDISKREIEQMLFIDAFNKSLIQDKRIVCVTDSKTGQFKNKDRILEEVTMEITN